MDFRFEDPEWLWLLLLLPLLALLRGRRGPNAAVRFPAMLLARGAARTLRSRAGRWLGVTRLLILAGLLMALARPQAGSGVEQWHGSGVEIMLAVDLSGSMWAHDFELDGRPVDRLTVVKHVVDEFIERRALDRIGLVAFAPEAYVVSPLTVNHTWVRRNLDRLHIGMIDPNGTAIGVALSTALNRFDPKSESSQVVVLLTDGANNTGEVGPIAAAEAAAALGVRVYTIAAGRLDDAPFPQLRPDGQPATDSQGRRIMRRMPADLDLETLERMAEITGGRAFHADTREELEGIYDAIDALESADYDVDIHVLYRDLFHLPLAASLILLTLEQLLRQTRLRRIP